MTLKINPNQLNNPATSDWLRAALQDALRPDPLDALNDAQILEEILKARHDALVAQNQ